jgi:hypothetical protein
MNRAHNGMKSWGFKLWVSQRGSARRGEAGGRTVWLSTFDFRLRHDPDRFLTNYCRGAPLRGRGTPAIPARLRSERARNLY